MTINDIDPAQLADMTQMSVKNLMELRKQFARDPSVTKLIDEQAELLLRNVELARAIEGLRERVKRGQMADFVAAIQMGGISRVARETHDEIALNGVLIRHLLARRVGPVVEA